MLKELGRVAQVGVLTSSAVLALSSIHTASEGVMKAQTAPQRQTINYRQFDNAVYSATKLNKLCTKRFLSVDLIKFERMRKVEVFVDKKHPNIYFDVVVLKHRPRQVYAVRLGE